MQKRALPRPKIIFVCTNCREADASRTSCGPSGGCELREQLKEMVKQRRLRSKIRVSQSGCLDRCEDGPNIMVFPDNVWYSGVQPQDLDAILNDAAAPFEQHPQESIESA